MIIHNNIERTESKLDLEITCEIALKEKEYSSQVFAKKYRDEIGEFWRVSLEQQDDLREIEIDEDLEQEFQFYLVNHDNEKAAMILANEIESQWRDDYTENLDKEDGDYETTNYYEFYGVKPSDFF